MGTVIDYAYHMYNSDNRLAHTPYHSLSISEREAHNARKNLLSHLSARFREKALERAHLSQTGIDYYRNLYPLFYCHLSDALKPDYLSSE